MGPKSDWIPVMKPSPQPPSNSYDRLEKVHQRRVFSNFGPEVVELEEELSRLLGVNPSQVVVTSNATIGLSGALQISAAPRFRLPSFTFAATAHAILQSSKRGEFSDINESTCQIRLPQGAEVDQQTGTLLVLPFGAGLKAFDWGPSEEVVVDAAASIFACLPDLRLMPKSTAIVFSLHATKCIGVGEGGVVVFGSQTRAMKFRKWINFGFDSGRISSSLGTNGKMSEYIAALLNTELENLAKTREEWISARALIESVSASGMKLFKGQGATEISPYWIVFFQNEKLRNKAIFSLRENAIESRLWWGTGCHNMPAFGAIKRASLPVTEKLAKTYLGLPFFRGITRDQVERIVRTLENID